MNLAVKLYSKMPLDDENILKGISGKIPAEVRFNVDSAPDENYTIMNLEEYNAYLESIQTDLDNWKTIQNNSEQLTEN